MSSSSPWGGQQEKQVEVHAVIVEFWLLKIHIVQIITTRHFFYTHWLKVYQTVLKVLQPLPCLGRAVFVQALLVKMAKDELSLSVVLCIFQQCHRQVQFCPSAESCFWQMAAQTPQDSAYRSKFILYEGKTCWHLRSLKLLWPFSGRIQDNSITQKGSRECRRGIFNMSFFFFCIH